MIYPNVQRIRAEINAGEAKYEKVSSNHQDSRTGGRGSAITQITEIIFWLTWYKIQAGNGLFER